MCCCASSRKRDLCLSVYLFTGVWLNWFNLSLAYDPVAKMSIKWCSTFMYAVRKLGPEISLQESFGHIYASYILCGYELYLPKVCFLLEFEYLFYICSSILQYCYFTCIHVLYCFSKIYIWIYKLDHLISDSCIRFIFINGSHIKKIYKWYTMLSCVIDT